MISLTQFLIEAVSTFYIGHSLVSPVVPAMVQHLLGQPVEMQIINGAPLELQWKESRHAQGVDGRVWLPNHAIDNLVITERVPLAVTVEYHDSANYAGKWLDLARQSNPDVQSYLYQTWDDIDAGSTRPWRDRILSDLPIWQQIVHDVNAARPEGAKPMRLIPAGLGMVRLYDAIEAGQVPGATSIHDFFRDGIHPTETGGYYYVAMIHYAALTGKSPEGATNQIPGEHGPYPKVPKDQAAVLQRLAWDVVRDFNAGNAGND